jgi:hypothetical protein
MSVESNVSEATIHDEVDGLILCEWHSQGYLVFFG